MVIDSNNIQSTIGNRSRTDTGASVKSSSTEKAEVPTQKSTEPQSQVSLSSEGKILSRLETNMQDIQAVDSDKVATIKKALEDGSYSINPERIAEKMLEQDDLFR